MINPTRIFLTAALGLTISAMTAPAVAQVKYTITTLGAPDASQTFTPSGINDRGQVWGTIFYFGPTSVQHGGLWQNGVLRDLGPSTFIFGITDLGERLIADAVNDVGYFVALGSRKIAIGTSPGGTLTQPAAVNDLGVVVGSTSFSDGSRQSFWWFGGAFHRLNIPYPFVWALAVNDLGEIAGMTSKSVPPTPVNPGSLNQVFVWQNGHYIILPTGSADYAHPTGINLAGNVVGFYGESNGDLFEGFLYAKGKLNTIGTLGLGRSYALGVNNLDQVVGEANSDPTNIPYNEVAIIYEKGHVTDLNTLIPANTGWHLTQASGINNLGQIVGNGSQGGFLLNPIR
jgi:uncharacterized membrane protein